MWSAWNAINNMRTGNNINLGKILSFPIREGSVHLLREFGFSRSFKASINYRRHAISEAYTFFVPFGLGLNL